MIHLGHSEYFYLIIINVFNDNVPCGIMYIQSILLFMGTGINVTSSTWKKYYAKIVKILLLRGIKRTTPPKNS